MQTLTIQLDDMTYSQLCDLARELSRPDGGVPQLLPEHTAVLILIARLARYQRWGLGTPPAGANHGWTDRLERRIVNLIRAELTGV